MINAVYLKAQWKKQFKKEDTRKEDFHLNEKKIIKVNMMHSHDFYGYDSFPELDADVLVSDYEVSQFFNNSYFTSVF